LVHRPRLEMSIPQIQYRSVLGFNGLARCVHVTIKHNYEREENGGETTVEMITKYRR